MNIFLAELRGVFNPTPKVGAERLFILGRRQFGRQIDIPCYRCSGQWCFRCGLFAAFTCFRNARHQRCAYPGAFLSFTQCVVRQTSVLFLFFACLLLCFVSEVYVESIDAEQDNELQQLDTLYPLLSQRTQQRQARLSARSLPSYHNPGKDEEDAPPRSAYPLISQPACLVPTLRQYQLRCVRVCVCACACAYVHTCACNAYGCVLDCVAS